MMKIKSTGCIMWTGMMDRFKYFWESLEKPFAYNDKPGGVLLNPLIEDAGVDEPVRPR